MYSEKTESTVVGNMMQELLEIEKLRQPEKEDGVGLEAFTKDFGGSLTIICC